MRFSILASQSYLSISFNIYSHLINCMEIHKRTKVKCTNASHTVSYNPPPFNSSSQKKSLKRIKYRQFVNSEDKVELQYANISFAWDSWHFAISNALREAQKPEPMKFSWYCVCWVENLFISKNNELIACVCACVCVYVWLSKDLV